MSNLEKEKLDALNWVNKNEKRVVEVSNELWEYAELGFIEHKSAKLLSDELERHGFRLERGVAGIPTAFVASWGSGKPIIGVMGEYDALMGVSQKKTPRREPIVEGGNGHGCGHNIHGTSGIAGAIAARYAMEKHGLDGTIRFFGTPAEESGSGKVWMVRAGVFDGVEAVLSHHPGAMNYGGIGSSLANNSVKFHFFGKTSHAAGSPEQGRSALDAVELMNIGLNYLREHVIQDARMHYVIEAGGGQPNVVPDYARSWYLIRAPEREQVDSIYSRVLKIAEGATLMTETRFEVEFLKAVYNKLPSKTLSNLVSSNMRLIGAPKWSKEEMAFAEELSQNVPPEQKRDSLRKSKRPGWEKLEGVIMDASIPDAWDEGEVGHGSTDVSDVSWKAPTMEFSTATWPLGIPGHSWMNVAASGTGTGHKSLIFASKIIAASVVDLLTKPELLKEAWEEQNRRSLGKIYKSPLPVDAKPPLEMWGKKN
ncbi:MAG: amidohydrolase [Candidatus Bathyarchaeota archaeon]|nr:amidohydrolase [Candidatus Bathyarchaeota archaeon]